MALRRALYIVFRRFPIFSIGQDIYATRYPNLYRVFNTIFFDIFYGSGKNNKKNIFLPPKMVKPPPIKAIL